MNMSMVKNPVTGLAGLVMIGAFFFLPSARLVVSAPPTPIDPQPLVVFDSRFTGADLAGRPVASNSPSGSRSQ